MTKYESSIFHQCVRFSRTPPISTIKFRFRETQAASLRNYTPARYAPTSRTRDRRVQALKIGRPVLPRWRSSGVRDRSVVAPRRTASTGLHVNGANFPTNALRFRTTHFPLSHVTDSQNTGEISRARESTYVSDRRRIPFRRSESELDSISIG